MKLSRKLYFSSSVCVGGGSHLINLLHSRFIVYCMIGCTGAFLDFILYTFLVNFLHINYLLSNCFSVSIGITNNFFLNAFFNFKVTDGLIKRFFSFYFVGIIGLIISEILLYILVDISSINTIIAKVITIFVITLIQFFMNKIITFKKSK